MSLYPSLEDMKVDHLAQAQQQHVHQQAIAASTGGGAPTMGKPSFTSSLYPSLGEFMGLEISDDALRRQMPETAQEVIQYQPKSHGMVAPITGPENMGLIRAEVKAGVREIVACKDQSGKLGIRVQHINKGVFVSLVTKGSPAALAGLRFGDQILQINGTTLAGYECEKVMKLIKNAPAARIELAIRDRPFERTITLQKDSSGHVGFMYKNGKIISIVKDSSAARNGLLIEHNMLEVNGQNIVGLQDKEISKVLTAADRSITLTIIPTFIYDHMVKCMKDSLVKKEMDHSIPDL